MRIIVDKEGKEVMNQLLDIALKTNGLPQLNGVVGILKSIEDYKEVEKVELEEEI